jgi:transcription antitermination factor NusB
MQAVYAYHATMDNPKTIHGLLLKEAEDELSEMEKKKKLSGDTHLLNSLFYGAIENREQYDQHIKSKAENWELDRIARIDRILMHMGICEMLNFEEIPIKVTINEYLELAKTFSTPKSSKFINGILDSLYNDFKRTGLINKSGRGLIDRTMPKQEVTEPPAQQASETSSDNS